MDTLRFDVGVGGVVTRPDGDGPHPAVVVVPAIAGVNEYIQRVCRRLATDGYLALGLDYYLDREVPDLSSMDRILAAVAALSDPWAMDALQASVTGLAARDDVDAERVGVVGFCIGGSYAAMAASRTDGLACAVGFYGLLTYRELTDNKPVAPIDTLTKLTAPLLLHYGDDDHLVPTDEVEEARRRTAGAQAEIHRYPGAGHAFHEDFRDVYRPVAAQTAWERTRIYLDWYLRGTKRLLEGA